MIVYPTNQGSPLNIFTSVLEIVRRDPQLGEEPVADAVHINRIYYTAPTDLDGFGRPFIAQLLNSSAIIYVQAVGGNFVLEDGTPISDVFGLTVPDSALLLGDQELPAIVIYYDYTNGNGDGYAVFDENGDEICVPSYVLLGHELSHALHHIIGDHPDDTAEAHEQIVIPEENEIRAEHGLTLRDTVNDGAAFPSDACASTDAGSSSSCFVLTAALGMERHDPIAALHELRRRLLGRTRFAILFYAQLRHEYYSFGPALAEVVGHDTRLRQAVREAIIEPFLGWAALLDDHYPGRAIGASISRHRFQHAENSGEIAEALRLFSIWLRGDRREPVVAPPGRVADVSFDELLNEIAANVARGCGTAPFTAWSVVEPARLQLLWSAPGARLDPGHAIDRWINDIPIPERLFTLGPAALTEELSSASHHGGLLAGAAGGGLAARIEEGFRRRGRIEQADRVAAHFMSRGGCPWPN